MLTRSDSELQYIALAAAGLAVVAGVLALLVSSQVLHADALAAARDAVATAVLAGAGTLAGLALAGRSDAWRLRWADLELREKVEFELRQLELAIQRDLDGDGRIGPPAVRERLIPVRVAGSDTPRPEIQPAGEPDIYRFLVGCYTRGPAQRAWVRPGQPRVTLPSGRAVTRGTYDDLVRQLEAVGLVQRTSAGRVMTRPIGEAVRALGLARWWAADGFPLGEQPGE